MTKTKPAYEINRKERESFTRLFRPSLTAALVVIALLASAPLAAAQTDERDRGFYLGITFIGSSLHVDDDGQSALFVKDDGGGAQFKAGYSINDVFSLELGLGGARHDTSNPAVDARFALFQIFAHYRFSPGNAFRPYIKGGFGGYALVFDANIVEAQIDGGGIPIGGGFDYFFSKHFSLGVDFTHNIIKYDKVTINLQGIDVGFDIAEEGWMRSLGLALTYYF
jgi:hypothetical protein